MTAHTITARLTSDQFDLLCTACAIYTARLEDYVELGDPEAIATKETLAAGWQSIFLAWYEAGGR